MPWSSLEVNEEIGETDIATKYQSSKVQNSHAIKVSYTKIMSSGPINGS